MTVVEVIAEAELVETRQERAQRRVTELQSYVQSAFETLAAIYRDEDWKYVNDVRGRPYSRFTEFVQDQLDCVASNARRYQQGITSLVLPLQELTAPGTRIPVTSADVAKLGVTGARVVVEEAPDALNGVTDSDSQTEVLRGLIDKVAKRGTPEFGPLVVESNPSAALGSLVPSALPAPAAPDTDDDGASDPPWSQDAPAADHAPRSAAAGGEDSPTPAGGDDLPPWSTPEHPEPAATPAHGPEVEASPLFSHTTTEPGGGGGGVDALASAINTVLAAGEPDALVAHVERGQCAARAAQCISAAQKLARLGQLLRSAAADPA
jgi:hypothetical protein